MYRCAIAERCLNGKILQMREVEIIGTVLQMAGLMRRQELIDTKVLFPRGMQADPRRQKEKGPIRGHSRAGVMARRIDRHDRHGTPAQRFCKELQHTGDLTKREPACCALNGVQCFARLDGKVRARPFRTIRQDLHSTSVPFVETVSGRRSGGVHQFEHLGSPTKIR